LLTAGAVILAFGVGAIPIFVSGKNPAIAYMALVNGAIGSPDALGFALNKSAPYILAGVGVALCFRARIINIGSEGQIAVGGIASSWVALSFPNLHPWVLIPAALLAGALGGGFWSAMAAFLRVARGVHEVLSTLMLNFVGTLLVSEMLHGAMGESGAGFPQSPLFVDSAWLVAVLPGSEMHAGVFIALVSVIVCHVLLWHTPFGFRLRLIGSSHQSATYAGVSVGGTLCLVMWFAGALAGIAGGIQVLGVHYRLIEGFSQGFGFNAIAIALLAALNPLAVLPAGLFFGFLEAGALAMQRETGVPTSLVFIIQGLTMLFVLCAMGIGTKSQRV
jgi:simple sugar transport system permease protein